MKRISFREVTELNNDSRYLVWTGLELPSTEEGLDQLKNDMTEFFVKQNLIPEGICVSNLNHISGNVREHTGDYRKDVLIKFSENTTINPMVRLEMSMSGLKWVSDFIVNFKNDYLY